MVVIYTDMKNGLEAVVRQAQLLPLHRAVHRRCRQHGEGRRIRVHPLPNAVVNNAARSCLTGYIYSALVDSFCSEQSARMTAMNAADQNAEELLEGPVRSIQPGASGRHHPGDHRGLRR